MVKWIRLAVSILYFRPNLWKFVYEFCLAPVKNWIFSTHNFMLTRACVVCNKMRLPRNLVLHLLKQIECRMNNIEIAHCSAWQTYVLNFRFYYFYPMKLNTSFKITTPTAFDFFDVTLNVMCMEHEILLITVQLENITITILPSINSDRIWYLAFITVQLKW